MEDFYTKIMQHDFYKTSYLRETSWFKTTKNGWLVIVTEDLSNHFTFCKAIAKKKKERKKLCTYFYIFGCILFQFITKYSTEKFYTCTFCACTSQ